MSGLGLEPDIAEKCRFNCDIIAPQQQVLSIFSRLYIVSDQQVYIFEVTEQNFTQTVISNSDKIPVIVMFMGVWSEHCFKLDAILSDFANEFAGQFIFAKVDIDEQPELRKEYKIENVPSIKVFKEGKVVQSEEGVLEIDEIRALLKSYGIFRESDDLREQARAQHMAGNVVEAITLLTQAIKLDPANTRVAMDMVQVFLDINELQQAQGLFNKLPEKVQDSETGRSLAGQLSFKKLAAETEGKQGLQEQLATNPDDHDAHFNLAICLVAEHDYKSAMDHLFEIFTQDQNYKEGAAKEMIISLTNVLAPNEPELAQEFRRRLANITSQ